MPIMEGKDLVAIDFEDFDLDLLHMDLDPHERQRVSNFLIDTPPEERPTDPYEEIVRYSVTNPGWACKYILNTEILPFQSVIIDELWNKPFPMLIASRGASKSFLLAVYAVLRALFFQGSKIVLIGSSFRQSKIIFDYIDWIWQRSRIVQNACEGERPKRQNDGCSLKIGESLIMSIPLGDGTKIRGLRANYILVDEYDSVPYEIYQVVVRGFAAVKRDPIQSVKWNAWLNELRRQGIDTTELEKYDTGWNQIVLSGTAGYQFKHFFADYERYNFIIENKISGDASEFSEDLGDDFTSQLENLDYRDFSVMQIPYTELPEGYLDEKLVAQARATMPKLFFNMEYGALFAPDSDGFFKRSVLEYATCPVIGDDGMEIDFEPLLKGDPEKFYVMGIDPSHGRHDNFAICIIELGKPNKIVNILSISRKGLENLKKNDPSIVSIYDAGARAIQDLLTKFNIVGMAMDAGGGGRPVLGLLQDPNKLRSGDIAIYEEDDEEHRLHRGLHNMRLINFQSTIWVSDANHNLLNDFESRLLLFPKYKTNPAVGRGMAFNPLEDIYLEIQESKDEICCITMTHTKMAKEQFILVQTEADIQVTVKDRYTAILLANDAAHHIQDEQSPDWTYSPHGGRPQDLRKKRGDKPVHTTYEGPRTGTLTVVDPKHRKGKIAY